MGFTVKINETDHRGDVDGETPLSCLLRDALGTTGVRENRCWRSTIAPPASEVEVQIHIPPAFFDQIAGSPETAREGQRRPDENWQGTDSQTV
jgi:hypothetical protein